MEAKCAREALEPVNPEAFSKREAKHLIAHENGGDDGLAGLVAQTRYPLPPFSFDRRNANDSVKNQRPQQSAHMTTA